MQEIRAPPGLWPSFSYKTPLAHIVLLPPSLTAFSSPYLHQSHHLFLRRRPPPEMGSAADYYSGCEHDYQPHFLDSCSLCGRQLSQNSDIFMYRGNTPFCSQECRQEQIEMDEATEKKWKLASSSSSSKRRQTSDSAKDSDTNKAVRSGTTVAVA